MAYKKTIILLITVFSLSFYGSSTNTTLADTTIFNFEEGLKKVNHCTPWHHLKCVAITGTEVYEDSRDGKKVRHWWRMSYIGRACSEKHGKVFGTIFEGLFVIPHYTGVAIGSGFGYLVYAFRGPRDSTKMAIRQQKRANRKEKRHQQ